MLINWVTEIRAPLAASGYWHPEAASRRSPDAPHQRTKPINALDAFAGSPVPVQKFPCSVRKNPLFCLAGNGAIIPLNSVLNWTQKPRCRAPNGKIPVNFPVSRYGDRFAFDCIISQILRSIYNYLESVTFGFFFIRGLVICRWPRLLPALTSKSARVFRAWARGSASPRYLREAKRKSQRERRLTRP